MTDTTPLFESIRSNTLLVAVAAISLTSLAMNFVAIQNIDSLTGATAALSVEDVQIQQQQGEIIDEIRTIRTRVAGTASR